MSTSSEDGSTKFLEKIKYLEYVISKKDELIQELTSQLDKYKSVVFVPTTKNIVNAPRKVRAQGISAEPKAQKTLEDLGSEKFKIFPKSQRTKELLFSGIQGNDFLKNLSSQNIQELVEHMYVVEYKKGSTIIKEGDDGSILYCIEEGQAEVTKEGTKLSVMSPGRVFGELALLYNCTRTASVRALDMCKLWAIDRFVFQSILMRTELLKQKERQELLKSVPRFHKESDDTICKLVDLLEEMHIVQNKPIVRQSSHCDNMYIIAKGVINEVKENAGAQENVIKSLKRGEYFGNIDFKVNMNILTTFKVHSDEGADLLILDIENALQVLNDSQLSSPKIKDDLPSPNSMQPSKLVAMDPVDINSLLDVYLISTIGIGGFGRVELVQSKKEPHRSFALKIMKKNHIIETRQQDHILNERNIMLEIKCDFIVKLYKTFKDNKYLYMLLEPCLGGELWTLLRDKVSFDDNSSKFYVGSVVEGFTYLHSRGIIYRDLKPENLLLDQMGYLKMVDFGFSKKIGIGRRTWTFCGTPEYVAPEIILNRGHDVASDLWSLGILIFELLTGNPPFSGSEPMKTYNLILKGIETIDFPNLIPKHAQQLIKKLCRDTPSERLGHGSTSLKEIRKHKWFNNFNWEALRARTLRAPFILNISSHIDVSNFDSFPAEEGNIPPDDLSGWDQDF